MVGAVGCKWRLKDPKSGACRRSLFRGTHTIHEMESEILSKMVSEKTRLIDPRAFRLSPMRGLRSTRPMSLLGVERSYCKSTKTECC